MSAIEERLIQRIRDRADNGLRKYGTTMERTDLSLYDWLLHAHEECMDLAVYLERIDAIGVVKDDIKLRRFVDFHRLMLIDVCLQLEEFLHKYKHLQT